MGNRYFCGIDLRAGFSGTTALDTSVQSEIDLIGYIYDAVIEPDRWSDTIDRIRRHFGFHIAMIGVNLFPSGDVASHAELNAIRDLGVADLTGYSMLTTMPPCWMCGGALRHFKLSRLYVVRQPYDSGSAAWLAAEAPVPEIERVESPEAVQLFERWRTANPGLWPAPRLDTW